MQKTDYQKHSTEIMDCISRGKALLTVSDGQAVNTMTIGWGTLGFVWGKPMITVMVRDSRHTFKFIEKAVDFTVNMAVSGQKETFKVCGTQSGRDIDKFAQCGLSQQKVEGMESPCIPEMDINLTARIVFKQKMQEELLDEDYRKSCYPNGDYHTIYYGEITGVYLK